MSENGKTNALAAAETEIPAVIEAALLEGDVQRLKPGERTAYYRAICESVGLNWLTRPLDLLKGQDGKHRFYFRKEATDQLARTNQISFTTISRERIDDLYLVEIRGTLPSGRRLDDQGIVPYPEKATPTDRANAMMKAITKARRRVTLGLVGLGWQVAEEDNRGVVVDFSLETGKLIAEEAVAEDHSALLFGDRDEAENAVNRGPLPPAQGRGAPDMSTAPAEKTAEDAQAGAPRGATSVKRPPGFEDDPVAPQGDKQSTEHRKRAKNAMAFANSEHNKISHLGISYPSFLAMIETLADEGFDLNRMTYAGAQDYNQRVVKVVAQMLSNDVEAPAEEQPLDVETPLDPDVPSPVLTLEVWLREQAQDHNVTEADIVRWLNEHDTSKLYAKATGLDPWGDLPECLDELGALLKDMRTEPDKQARESAKTLQDA